MDIARGIVMVLMAIDHVRVYAGVPAGGPTAGLFLTRWVTHFCAPAFVFLAGVSIYLQSERSRNKPGALTRGLMLRGAWLVLLELTFLRLAWTFNFDFADYMLAGVIWMLGWCMILMGLLVRLPIAVNAAFGLLIIAGHNLTATLIGNPQHLLQSGDFAWLWKILYYGGAIAIGGAQEPNFFILYSIIPWIGVMAAGYAFGPLLRSSRIQSYIGLGAIAAFLILRVFNLYGDRPWVSGQGSPDWIAILNTTKYPGSFLFLLMTLGPLIAALPWLEKWRGKVSGWLEVFGRVPMFYYLLHIPLIHLLALAISAVRSPSAIPWLFGNHPLMPGRPPQSYMWSLPMLYLVTAIAVCILYFACRGYAAFKASHRTWWLPYL